MSRKERVFLADGGDGEVVAVFTKEHDIGTAYTVAGEIGQKNKVSVRFENVYRVVRQAKAKPTKKASAREPDDDDLTPEEEAYFSTPDFRLRQQGGDERLSIIDEIYHVLAKKFHPDKGGTTRAMADLNEAIRKVRGEK